MPSEPSTIGRSSPATADGEDLALQESLRHWWSQGRPLPAPPPVKAAAIREVARRTGLRILVETGTYRGDTVAALRSSFDGVVTIELDGALHARARARFAADPGVVCLRGDSGLLIPEVLARLDAPALFWLDAHYSGVGTARGASDTPILAEIRAILRHVIRQHVILVDDARLFGLDPAYPSIRELADTVAAERPDCDLDVALDIIRIAPGTRSRPTEAASPEAAPPAPGDAPGWLGALRAAARSRPLSQVVDFNQRDRDGWVARMASSVPPGAEVLDVGAGTCPYRPLFAHCRYRAHDFMRYRGEKLGGGTAYGSIDVVSEIGAIPLPSASLDVVLCTEVLEHVPGPAEAVREMARLLRPGGRLLLSAPLGSGLHQLPFHFYGGFTPEWYRRFLGEAGLDVLGIVPNGGFFRLLSQEVHRAASLLGQAAARPAGTSAELLELLGDTLPRWLHRVDGDLLVDQFTAGYFVEARKR